MRDFVRSTKKMSFFRCFVSMGRRRHSDWLCSWRWLIYSCRRERSPTSRPRLPDWHPSPGRRSFPDHDWTEWTTPTLRQVVCSARRRETLPGRWIRLQKSVDERESRLCTILLPPFLSMNSKACIKTVNSLGLINRVRSLWRRRTRGIEVLNEEEGTQTHSGQLQFCLPIRGNWKYSSLM